MTPPIQTGEDIERTISVIKSAIMKAGALSEDLVESIKAELAQASSDMISDFFKRLARECPAAVEHFTNSERAENPIFCRKI